MRLSLPANCSRLNCVAVCVLTLLWASAAHGDCVDSSTVSDFLVRNVTARARFSLTPGDLDKQLSTHRGDRYSAQKAHSYEQEIQRYLSTNAKQQRYEALFNRRLKLSASAKLVTLSCVQRVAPTTCTQDFAATGTPGVTECVDIVLSVYAMDVEILEAGRSTLPLPSSALATVYAAIPTPLLALNPVFSTSQDPATGTMVGIGTSTSLLDLKKSPASDSGQKHPITPTVISKDKDLEIINLGAGTPDESAASASTTGELPKNPTQLLLDLKGSKSVTKSFYDANGRLGLTHLRPFRSLQRFGAEAMLNSSQLPQGAADFRRNGAFGGVLMDFRPKNGPIQLVSFGAGYRWSHNNLTSNESQLPQERSTENGYETRVAMEGMVGSGLLRAVASFNRAMLNSDQGSYNRVAVRAGYGKEIPLIRKKDYERQIDVDGERCRVPYSVDTGKSEQTFGIEMQAGAGKAWGRVPEYARFFGGNQFGSFLYDDVSSLREFEGPLLRTSKVKQAGVVVNSGPQVGGTTYWHVNLNVSIPVARWSYPLIPHEWVTTGVVGEKDPEHTKDGLPLGESICVDLRGVLKKAVNVTATNLMIAHLARDKLTEDEKNALALEGRSDLTPEQQVEIEAAKNAYAANKAAVRPEVMALFDREILPVTNFIADRANFYSVKPLLLFDAARIMLPGARDDATRFGAGAGVQIDVVMARFELGYVAAINRIPGDGAGNVLVRLVIKRFF